MVGRHTRTVSCDSRDYNRSQNAVQNYSVIWQQDHLSRPEGRQKCNKPSTRWSAPNPQRAQGHREPRGDDSRLHQAGASGDSPLRAGRIHLHLQALLKVMMRKRCFLPKNNHIGRMLVK